MPNDTNYSDNEVILNQLLQRSTTDKAFRDRLLTAPEQAIEEVIGVPVASLPKPVRVRFVEKDASLDALVVLPDFADPEGALSDAELEAVAGGDWCITSCSLTIDVCFVTHNNDICTK